MTRFKQRARGMFAFRDRLTEMGFDEDIVADAIRLGEDAIPVFGGQLTGCYVYEDGRRDAHFAVPGWYRILHLDGNTITLRSDKPNADVFVCGVPQLWFVLRPNLDCVIGGLNP